MKPLFLTLFISLPALLFCQKNISSKEIAEKYFSSVVKILLVDSTEERAHPGKGYFGRGSGFIVSEDGVIFTNRHVVLNALGTSRFEEYDGEKRTYKTFHQPYTPEHLATTDIYQFLHISKMSIIVQIFDRPGENFSTLYEAKILSIDTSYYDGAILKITRNLSGAPIANNFNPIAIGNSDSTFQGEDLFIMGFPEQFKGSYEQMLIDQNTSSSGKHAGFDFFVDKNGLIKTDARINAGNSGGPVFNAKGQVIGLATSSNEKTDNGFIVKINGMYNLAKHDFALATLLDEKGLKAPSNRNLSTSGVWNNPSYLLPSESRVDRRNKELKQLRQFLGGFWYLKSSLSFFNEASYQIDASSSSFVNVTNPNSKLTVKPFAVSYGLELGKVMPLYHFSDYSKLCLDFTLAGVNYVENDWSGVNLFSDSLMSSNPQQYPELSMNRAQGQMTVYSKIGLLYSAIVNKQFLFDIYAKFGAYGILPPSSASNYAVASYPNTNQNISFNAIGYLASAGINFHVKHLMVGLEGNYGVSIPQQTFFGNIYTDASRTSVNNISASHSFYNFNLTFGLPIYNNKRWKKYY